MDHLNASMFSAPRHRCHRCIELEKQIPKTLSRERAEKGIALADAAATVMRDAACLPDGANELQAKALRLAETLIDRAMNEVAIITELPKETPHYDY